MGCFYLHTIVSGSPGLERLLEVKLGAEGVAAAKTQGEGKSLADLVTEVLKGA